MSSRTYKVLPEAVAKKYRALQDKLHKARQAVEDIEGAMERLVCGQSPIKVGDFITWTSGAKERRGRVESVRDRYDDFEYRCTILSKAGAPIGMANVSESQSPQLEE